MDNIGNSALVFDIFQGFNLYWRSDDQILGRQLRQREQKPKLPEVPGMDVVSERPRDDWSDVPPCGTHTWFSGSFG